MPRHSGGEFIVDKRESIFRVRDIWASPDWTEPDWVMRGEGEGKEEGSQGQRPGSPKGTG